MRFVILLSLLASATAYASPSDGFRCPDTDKLIDLGQSTYDVRSRCREPDAQTQRTDMTLDGHSIVIDEWTFDFGPHYLIRKLRFENDRLVRVFDGKYGTKGS